MTSTKDDHYGKQAHRKLFFFRLDTEETKGKQKSGMSRSQKKNGVLACRFLELHPGKDEIPITVDGLRSCRDDKGEQFVPQFLGFKKILTLADVSTEHGLDLKSFVPCEFHI